MVRKLMVRGVSNSFELQSTLERNDPPLKLTVRTIRRYKAIIRRRNLEIIASKEGVAQSADQVIITLKNQMDEVLKELWRVYHSTTNPGVKVSALREIREGAEKWVDKLQSMGFVYKAPDKHQMVGADGEPADPNIIINVETLNQQFIGFIKDQWQNPIGATGTHEVVNRNEPAAKT